MPDFEHPSFPDVNLRELIEGVSELYFISEVSFNVRDDAVLMVRPKFYHDEEDVLGCMRVVEDMVSEFSMGDFDSDVEVSI